nr:immunoglobulin heavy chain junction region [Mus musculus]
CARDPYDGYYVNYFDYW